MKHVLSLSLLLALVVGCSKKEEPSGDPLLGHWQGDTVHYLQYDAQGQVTYDITSSQSTQLDVTATTMSLVYSGNGPGSTGKEEYQYTRQGEVITVLPSPQPRAINYSAVYARSLTPTSFTYEVSSLTQGGGKVILFQDFHR